MQAFPLILSSVSVSLPPFRFLTSSAGSAVPSTPCRGHIGRQGSPSAVPSILLGEGKLRHRDTEHTQLLGEAESRASQQELALTKTTTHPNSQPCPLGVSPGHNRMGKATKRAVGAIPAGSGCSRETVLPTAALPVAVGFSFPPLRCSLLSTVFSSSPPAWDGSRRSLQQWGDFSPC